MDRVAETLLPKRELTQDELESVQDVLDAALAVVNRQLDLTTFMRMGIVEYDGRPSPPYTRWIATGTGSKDDPRWKALQRILDLTVRKQHIVTAFGVFQHGDMHQHDAAIRFLQGQRDGYRDAA